MWRTGALQRRSAGCTIPGPQHQPDKGFHEIWHECTSKGSFVRIGKSSSSIWRKGKT
jgi:hypothetical protein